MISTLNIAKFLRHNVFGNNTFMTIRFSERISTRSFMYMHTYKISGFSSSFPVAVIEYKRFSINVFKCLAPAVRSYSSDFNQEHGEHLIVKHDPVGKEFLSEVAGLGVARITFERHGQLVILKHTDVPNQLSGLGIGKILAKVRWPHKHIFTIFIFFKDIHFDKNINEI